MRAGITAMIRGENGAWLLRIAPKTRVSTIQLAMRKYPGPRMRTRTRRKPSGRRAAVQKSSRGRPLRPYWRLVSPVRLKASTVRTVLFFTTVSGLSVPWIFISYRIVSGWRSETVRKRALITLGWA